MSGKKSHKAKHKVKHKKEKKATKVKSAKAKEPEDPRPKSRPADKTAAKTAVKPPEGRGKPTPGKPMAPSLRPRRISRQGGSCQAWGRGDGRRCRPGPADAALQAELQARLEEGLAAQLALAAARPGRRAAGSRRPAAARGSPAVRGDPSTCSAAAWPPSHPVIEEGIQEIIAKRGPTPIRRRRRSSARTPRPCATFEVGVEPLLPTRPPSAALSRG